MTNINTLVNKYFEGETSVEEEKILRQYFTAENLPHNLQQLAPIFRYMDNEATALSVLQEIHRETRDLSTKSNRVHRIIAIITSVAASLLIGILLLKMPTQKNQNYTWVNGKRITNSEAIRQYAQESFEKVQSEDDFIENQLSNMFQDQMK